MANRELSGDTQYRNDLARVYYLTTRERLIEIYRSVNGDLVWSMPKWLTFINSRALDELVHEKIATLSAFTREKVAYCDPINELDNVMLEGDEYGGTSVPCIQLAVHERTDLVKQLEGPSQGPVLDAFGPVGIGQYATRQLIKAMVQMFLKDVLEMEFRVVGLHCDFSGFWSIDDELKYVLVE